MLFEKMKMKIPKLPLSALIFYLVILLLWRIGLIPSPNNILTVLENLYTSFGLMGLFIASFLEGIVYLGLYFPGSVIVALAVILSNGSFISLLSISLVVALALTLTATINYFLGRKFSSKFEKDYFLKERKIASKGFFISMLHPNILAFYFFNSGIKKHNLLKILLVPPIMIPYGLFLGYIILLLKTPLEKAIESPYIMITLILIWIITAFFFQRKKPV